MTNILPQTPSFDLSGKRALVVGASSGIGLGCAVAVAQAGAETVLAARRLPELQETAALLTECGLNASAVVLNIADAAAVMDYIADQPAFDVAINSAGLARHGPSLETTIEDYRAVMQVNLEGAYFLSQAVAKRLVAAEKAGSIVHISSQMGKIGGIERAVYCASKHGLDGMIKTMAIEWGKQNIRINSVCPTFVRTALTEPTFADSQRVAWIMEKIKLPRIAEVEDIMGAVLFLASDAAAMITGTSLLVDGGWTAG